MIYIWLLHVSDRFCLNVEPKTYVYIILLCILCFTNYYVITNYVYILCQNKIPYSIIYFVYNGMIIQLT